MSSDTPPGSGRCVRGYATARRSRGGQGRIDGPSRGLEPRRSRWVHGRVLEVAGSHLLLQRHRDARLAADTRSVSRALPRGRKADGNARHRTIGPEDVGCGSRADARPVAPEDAGRSGADRDDDGHFSKTARRLAHRARSLIEREQLTGQRTTKCSSRSSAPSDERSSTLQFPARSDVTVFRLYVR
jgi:hypothetical protein